MTGKQSARISENTNTCNWLAAVQFCYIQANRRAVLIEDRLTAVMFLIDDRVVPF
jgi:hypothetical protein